ncbi:hypothetical protein RF11_09369 [Thelohanellus kitauei]|uniref:Tc1-like transposase DDE domain-containing protein n=1 Tax=Thelohanellus kitauei TaxID=669202 RepID=A0A0C2MBI9_THEKT|nr:hypothetical protein RF11_09369 [Thelohanellus kitauei]
MIDVDLSTIHRIWKEYQISGKIAKALKGGNRAKSLNSSQRIKFIPERRNIPGTIQERHDYVIKYLEYSASNRFILFIDETGFDVSNRQSYGRATGGNPTEKNIKSKNMSVCSAISRTSIMFDKVSERAFNNYLYMHFLSNLMNILNE